MPDSIKPYMQPVYAYHKDAECFECEHSKTALTIDGDVWQICFIRYDKTCDENCPKWKLHEEVI